MQGIRLLLESFLCILEALMANLLGILETRTEDTWNLLIFYLFFWQLHWKGNTAEKVSLLLRFVSLTKNLIYDTILKTREVQPKNTETVREKKGMITRIFLVHFDSSWTCTSKKMWPGSGPSTSVILLLKNLPLFPAWKSASSTRMDDARAIIMPHATKYR